MGTVAEALRSFLPKKSPNHPRRFSTGWGDNQEESVAMGVLQQGSRISAAQLEGAHHLRTPAPSRIVYENSEALSPHQTAERASQTQAKESYSIV